MTTRLINIKNAPDGWESNPQYVYIGRSGKGQTGYFGNPIHLSPEESRGATLERFEAYARERIQRDPEYREAVKSLEGKTLVCFCQPKPCHGLKYIKLCKEIGEGLI